MSYNSIAILGIPIENLNIDETVEHIFAMIDAYNRDKRPRQVATVNVDFVVNTLTWRLKYVRHPELLDILRRADLVPKLTQEAARRQKSIYLSLFNIRR
jgi:UDP-N-acetyl-D-mannosaminuronic acid transferase (WecB/TagA/CpsF family)